MTPVLPHRRRNGPGGRARRYARDDRIRGGPTDEQLDDFASWERRSWEAHAASYARCITDLTRGAADALLDAAEVTADTSLLDVAAGPALDLYGAVAQVFDLADPVPPGPDPSLYADDDRLTALLLAAGLVDIRITRARWPHTVAGGAWFDAVAAGTPRTGAVLAAASAEQRAVLRSRYAEVAKASYEGSGGLVTLPAAAVVGSGRTRPAQRPG